MRHIGVGFFVGAGIPKGERVNTFIECGCCGAYHRTDFEGDCREDSERYHDLPDDAEVIYLDEEDDEQVEVRQTICKHCGQDIENFTPYRKGEWRDRGNNTHCPNEQGDREQKHAPVNSGNERK